MEVSRLALLLSCLCKGIVITLKKETKMKKLIACTFNMTSSCVELKSSDSSMSAINYTAMENKIADNVYPRSSTDYLIPVDACCFRFERHDVF